MSCGSSFDVASLCLLRCMVVSVYKGLYHCREALSLLDCDIYRTGRPQCHMMYWIRFDGLAGNQGKTDAVGDGGEQQSALHHGEVEANADAWACAERLVRITGKLFLPFGCEALRIKLLRLREVFLSTVQGVRSEQDDPAFGDAVAVNLDIAQGTPGCHIRG